MNNIIERLICEEEEISARNPVKKVYTHSLIELKKLYDILKNDGSYYEGIYFVDPNLLVTLNRYLDRLKKIRSHYYDLIKEIELPHTLRAPILETGDVIKIKKEIKSSNFEKPKEILHITFTNCKAKHIELDGKAIIIVGYNNSTR